MFWAGGSAANSFRVLDISFSEMENKTVALYESALGVFYIEALDLPDSLLRPEEVSALPRFSNAFCDLCVALSDLGQFREEKITASAVLSIFPGLLLPQRLNLLESAGGQDFQSKPGFFLNYQLQGSYGSTSKDKRGAAELEAGLGLGRLGTIYHSELVEEGGHRTRNQTYIRHIDVEGLSEISLGDITARSGALGSAFRLLGIKRERNYGIDPNVINTPVYAFNAVNAQPTVVDLYIDGQRQRRQEVEAGEFTLEGVRGNHGSEVTLVLEDAFGNKRVVRSTLLGTYNQLGKGRLDYSYSLGLLRQSESKYKDLAGSVDVGYGFSNNLTLKLHQEGTLNKGMVSFGFIWATRPFIFEGYGAKSLGDSEGYAFRYGVTSAPGRLWRRVSFGVNGQTSKEYEGITGGESGEFQRAYLSSRLGRFSAGVTHERSLDSETKEVDVSTSLSVSTHLGRNFGLVVGGRRFNYLPDDDLWFAGISWAPSQARVRVAVGAFGNRSAQGRNVDLSAPLPFGNTAMSLTYDQVRNQNTELLTERADLHVNSRFDDVAIDYQLEDTTDSDFHTLSLRGGVALAAWRPYFVPYLSSSAGYMQVETELPRVGVKRGSYSTRSDFRGVAVVPTQGYGKQSVIVDRSTLKDGYSIQPIPSNKRVLPGARGKVDITINPPGFLLHIRGLEAPADVYWNGVALPYFEMGAYIENAVLGANQLIIKGATYNVPIEEISVNVPDYYFDPAKGEMSVETW
jgi:outer membrane usher protein FimD/PapC